MSRSNDDLRLRVRLRRLASQARLEANEARRRRDHEAWRFELAAREAERRAAEASPRPDFLRVSVGGRRFLVVNHR